MNTEYRRYVVKVDNAILKECDDLEEAKKFAFSVSGIVFDNYEYAIIFRA